MRRRVMDGLRLFLFLSIHKMKKKYLLLIGLLSVTLCVSAKRVGAYCYFANNGSQLYEDENVKVVLAMENNDLKMAIYNKTDNVIFVDKANTFAYTNGNPETLFKNSATTTSNTKSSGASVNLGGIAGALGVGGVAGGILSTVNVGGGNSSQTGTVVYEQRVISVAPKSINILYTWDFPTWSCPHKYFYNSVLKLYNNNAAKHGRFIDTETGNKVKFEKGMSRSYTEDYTPFSAKGVVRYSTEENFATSQQATISNYITDIIIDSYKGVKDAACSLPYCQQLKERRADYCFVSGVGWTATPGGCIGLIGGGLAVICLPLLFL